MILALQSIAIIVVVWLLASVRSSDSRAILYSLPIPFTIVLIGVQPDEISSAFIVGVALLIGFFWIVSLLIQRAHVRIFTAVGISLAIYIAVALLVTTLPNFNFWLGVGFYVTAYLIFLQWITRNGFFTALPRVSLLNRRRNLTITATVLIAAALGSFLGPFTVTFPYSGVPLAVDSHKVINEMTKAVTFNSISLVSFFVGMYLTQGSNLGWQLVAGWICFGLTQLALFPFRRKIQRLS